MALIPSSRYPSQVDADGAYPQGKARNASSFQAGDGTPLERDWVNDAWGFFQSLLAAGGISPSGNPDEVGASDYLTATQAVASQVAIGEIREALDPALLRLRLIGTNDPFSDSSLGIAIISGLTATSPSLAIKSGSTGVRSVFDGDDYTILSGTVASITSVVVGVARNGSRLVVVGTGGNRVAISTNEGSTWAAGDDLGATPGVGAILYNGVHSRFVVGLASGVNVLHDVDADSVWSSVSSGLTSGQGGLAMFSNGDMLYGGLDGSSDVAIARSVDGGDSWSAGATVPNADEYGDSGWLAGDGGTLIYHAGRALSGAELRICATTSAMSWTLLATITPPATISSKGRLLLCPDTGILVVVYGISGADVAHVSRDQGVTWSAPTFYRSRNVNSYGIARGRLFATFGPGLYATDKLI